MRIETRRIIDNYYTYVDEKRFVNFAKIIECKYKDRIAQMEIWKYD